MSAGFPHTYVTHARTRSRASTHAHLVCCSVRTPVRTHESLPCTYTLSTPTHAVLNYQVRRTAVDFGVPLLTNLNLVTMFADAMEKHSKNPMVGLLPSSLYDYYHAEKASDAWTSPTEFH